MKPKEVGEAVVSTGLRKLLCPSHISSPRASGSPAFVGTGQSKPSLMPARDRPSVRTGHTSCLSVPDKLIRQQQDVDALARTLPRALNTLGKHSARAPPQALGWYLSTRVFELH